MKRRWYSVNHCNKQTAMASKALITVASGAFHAIAPPCPLGPGSGEVLLLLGLLVLVVGGAMVVNWALSKKTTETLVPGAVNEQPLEQLVSCLLGVAQLGLAGVFPSVTPGPQVSPPQEIAEVSSGVAAARNLTRAVEEVKTDEGSEKSVGVVP